MELLNILQYAFLATILVDAILLLLYGYCYLFRARSRVFGTFCTFFFFLTLWESALWLELFFKTPEHYQLFIDQVAFASGALVSLFATRFAWHVTQRNAVSQRIVRILSFLLGGMAILTFFPNVVLSGRQYFSAAPYNYAVVPGPLLTVYYALIALVPFFVGLILARGMKSAGYLNRIYILITGSGLLLFVFFAAGSSTWIQLIEYFHVNQLQIGAEKWVVITQIFAGMSMTIFTLSASYAVARYRFMGFRIVFQKNVIYFVLLVCVSVLLILSAYFIGVYALGVLAALLLFVIGKYHARLKAFYDGLFFFDELDLSKRLSTEALSIDSTEKIESFFQDFIPSFEKEIFCTVDAVYISQRQHQRMVPIYSYQNTLASISITSIDKDTFIYDHHVLAAKENPALAKLFSMPRHSFALPVCKENVLALIIFSPHGDRELQLNKVEYFARTLNINVPVLMNWYETLEGLKRKLHNDIYESV
jgi:hypothetical protein